MAEAFEVATFYAHFDVIDDDDPSLKTTVRVCDSITCTCELFGANDLMKKLESRLDPKKVRVLRAPCMGLCDKAPACEVGHNHLEKFTLKDVKLLFKIKTFTQKLLKELISIIISQMVVMKF